MTYSDDPQHEKEPNNLNKNSESEREDMTHLQVSSNSQSNEDAEVEQLIKEERKAQKAQRYTIVRKINQSVSYLVAALEILLGLRFLLLITGANPNNLFASFIYALSEPFSRPFANLFGTIQLNDGAYVFDGNILFGMVIYFLLMLLVNWLIQIIFQP